MEEDEIKFCPKCGKRLESGQYFCSECGWKVENVNQNVAPYQSNVPKFYRKYNFMLAVKIIIICFAAIVALLAGYNKFIKNMLLKKSPDEYIDMVQKAHYENYSKINYEDVLYQYCDECGWEYFVSDNNKDIVEFTSKAVYKGENLEIRIQFKCEDDKVDYVYFEAGEKYKSKLDMEEFMELAYASYVPPNADRDIMGLMGEKMTTIEQSYCMNENNESDDILNESIGINYLSNRAWSVIDCDNDGYNDSVSIDNETKYNIMGLSYDDNYADISSKLSPSYKCAKSVNGGAGWVYAKNNMYYVRFKIDENKIKQIVLVNQKKAEAAGESFYQIEDDDSDAESSSDSDSYDDTEDGEDYSDDEDYSYEDDTDEDYYYDESDDYAEDDISQEAIDARWDDSDSYILPYSDVEKLKKSDIEKLNLKTIQFAINEICAREGRKFADHNTKSKYPDMKDFFNNKDWYTPEYDSVEFDRNVKDYLNDVEYYNYDLLAKVRNQKRGY